MGKPEVVLILPIGAPTRAFASNPCPWHHYSRRHRRLVAFVPMGPLDQVTGAHGQARESGPIENRKTSLEPMPRPQRTPEA